MNKSDIMIELNTISDDLQSIDRALDLLHKIQLSQGPVIQVLTIIKFEKPRLYSFLKNRLENNPGFKMMFDVSFEYKSAKKSLGL
jgi:hypothetical protein